MYIRLDDLEISVHRQPCNPCPTDKNYIHGSRDMMLNDWYQIMHVDIGDGGYLTIKRHLNDDEFEAIKKEADE